MKSFSKSVGLLVLGLVMGSLPYTLSLGRTVAQSPKEKRYTPRIEQFQIIGGRTYLLSNTGQITFIQTAKIVEGTWTSAPDLVYK